jgi:hypothetical protein
MTDLNALSIPTIVAFVFILNEATKGIAKSLGKDINRFIPIFSVAFGLILGVGGYFIPSMKMGDNIITAIITGIASGLAATGGHQVGHQLTKPNVQVTTIDPSVIEELLLSDDDEADDECDEDVDDPEEPETDENGENA